MDVRDHKGSWELKHWCFWAVVLEKTLESPLDCKEVQPAHPRGNQSQIFIGRTDAEVEALILWPSVAQYWLNGKDADVGKYWRWEEKGTTDEMVGWMASVTQWTWVWASSRSWWCIGKPGVQQSMGSQRFGPDWVTEMNWFHLYECFRFCRKLMTIRQSTCLYVS